MNPHAECTLLAYLHESSESGIRRFSYIAVTKLSCFSCWLLFEAYCKHQKHCFRLRGCHSDPSHPWVIPDFKDHKLEEACRKHILNDRIIKLFVLNLKQGGRLSKGRHSSDSGTGPNDLHQPDG
ncbi:hypothetical protein BDD12DRAFT_838048 [Trichophaea hybrida]|nr:hypothetical protein BDD12DRAFT_838048 [Trichophaea hybrida]